MEFLENGRRVNVGIVGLGGRGTGWLKALLAMKDVEVVALCDTYPDRLARGQELAAEAGAQPFAAADHRALVARDDVEAVLVFTSWETHIGVSIDALGAGKRVGMEVGGASSVEECWALVRASEKSGVPCMLLENCCYGRSEMTVLNMARMGLFGELVHCQGGYRHDLRAEVGNGDINRHYRQRHFLNRNGELYPTHELGPIAKLLNINRGNRMLTLTSMASKAAGLNAWFKEHRPDSDLCNRAVALGDVVTTLIKCAGGETIVLTHDNTLPRPYSRGGRVQGTKGLWMEDNASYYLEDLMRDEQGNPTDRWAPFSDALDKYEHPLWTAFAQSGVTGGHGGMDYLVMRAFIESVQAGALPPIDVYDAAAWMAITALSEQSIAMGGAPVAIPDFTGGR
ncbi:MAG: Gfo/Idh/MocA family oxidoreductase, partial [Clostridiales bacterium]|nr:Gfo/Idh/MocA family oxidoreductase [Clostridiales bacterium]